MCDHDARIMLNEARTQVVNYLHVAVGNEMGTNFAKVEMPLHPAYQRAKDVIEPDFLDIMMKNQNIMSNEKVRERMLKIIEKTELEELVKTNWEGLTDYDDPENSVLMWRKYKKIVTELSNKLPPTYKIDPVASAMFTLIYPRLDLNVSKGINHLLKSPF